MDTPEPKYRPAKVKEHHPTCDANEKMRAKQYGYCDRYAETIGCARELVKKRLEPVAFDTNQTRRKMVLPTKQGTWK